MIFLKLGGSLLTDKNQPQSVRIEVVRRVASEIAEAYFANPNMRLLLGHGSGSFGHFSANKFKTQHGASTKEEWLGFAEVWSVANQLNRIVVDALLEANLPVLSFPPSASVVSAAKTIISMADVPIGKALDAGLIPIVQGDVAFDLQQGSTIVSTEQIFDFLSPHLKPSLVLLAGSEEGVYQDYPICEEVIPLITEANIQDFNIVASAAPDVTGGMATKVQEALSLCQRVRNLKVRIFSGREKGTIRDALAGVPVGTLISSTIKGE